MPADTRIPPPVQSIPIEDIVVRADRLRALQSKVVAELAESFEKRGQPQPIGVIPCGGAGYRPLWGVHRLEAAKALGWTEIAGVVLDGLDADEAEVHEITENLISAELGAAERPNCYRRSWSSLSPRTWLVAGLTPQQSQSMRTSHD
jgi:ParB-like chromosome segregation protein Spo0J